MVGFCSLLMLSICSLSSDALGALPPEVIGVIQSLPEGKLNLLSVIQIAVKRSDSYRQLKAQAGSIQVPQMQVDGITDPRIFAQVGFQDDQREPPIAFQALRTKGTQYSLGVGSSLITGTDWQFEASHGTNSLDFMTIPNTTFAESRVLLSMSQSLWKNSFGRALRSAKESGAKTSLGRAHELSRSKDNWFLDLAGLFYDSWLAQVKTHEARASVDRRERLLKTVSRKAQRGTAERPDLLQIESARAASLTHLASMTQEVGDRFRGLITILGLPAEWLEIDPMLIPVMMDAPEEVAFKLCDQKDASEKLLEINSNVLQAKANSEAAQAYLAKVKSDNQPDLALKIGLGANDVDPTSGGTTQDLLALRHPYWSVGVRLSMPLGFNAENAAESEGAVQQIRSEAAFAMAKDQTRVEWKNACLDIRRLKGSQELMEKAVKMQTERVKLEEDRFRLGRSNTLQVIQAGDDLSEATLTAQSIAVQLKMAAWKIRVKMGGVSKQLIAWEAGQ